MGGQLGLSGMTKLEAEGDIKNLSGWIKGEEVYVSATNFLNETLSYKQSYDYTIGGAKVVGFGGQEWTTPKVGSRGNLTVLGKQGGIDGGSYLQIDVKQDAVFKGVKVNAADAVIKAGGAVTIGTIVQESDHDYAGSGYTSGEYKKEEMGSSFNLGSLQLTSVGATTIRGSTVESKNQLQIVAGSISIEAGETIERSQSHQEGGEGSLTGRGTPTRDKVFSELRHSGSVLKSGGNMVLQSTVGDIDVMGSSVEVGGRGLIKSAKSVNVLAVMDRRSDSESESSASTFEQFSSASGYVDETVKKGTIKGLNDLILVANESVLLAGGSVKAQDGVKLTGGRVMVAAVAEHDSSYSMSSHSMGVGGLTLATEMESVQIQDTRYRASEVKGQSVEVDARVFFGMGSQIEGETVSIDADKVILKSAVNRHEEHRVSLHSGAMDAMRDPKVLMGGVAFNPDVLFDTTTGTKTVSEESVPMEIKSTQGPIKVNGVAVGNSLTSTVADSRKDISDQLKQDLKDEMKGKKNDKEGDKGSSGPKLSEKDSLLALTNHEMGAALERFDSLPDVKGADGVAVQGLKLDGVVLESGQAEVQKKVVNQVTQIGLTIATGGATAALVVGVANTLANGDMSYMEGAVKSAALSYVGGQLSSGLNGVGLGGGVTSNFLNQTLSQGGADWLVNGGSLQDKLENAGKSVAISMAGKHLANKIGDQYEGNQGSLGGEVVHKLSHAALGCGMAVASSGSDQSCGAGAFGGVTGELLAQGMGDNYNLNAKDEKNERKAFLNTVTTLTSLSAQIVNLDGGIAGSTANNAVENNFLHDVCLVNPDLPQCQGLPGAGMEKVKLKSVTAQVGAFGLAVNATVDENGVSGGFSKTLIGKEPNKVGVSLMFEIDTGVNLPTPSTNRSSAAFSGTYCGPSFTCVGGGRDIKTGNQTFQFGFGTPVFSPSIDINPHN